MAMVVRSFRFPEQMLEPLENLTQFFGTEGAVLAFALAQLHAQYIGPLPLVAATYIDGLTKLVDFFVEVDTIVKHLQQNGAVDENVIRTAAECVATTPAILKKHAAAVAVLGALVVNQGFGRRVKKLTGRKSGKQARAFGPAANVITTFTRLS